MSDKIRSYSTSIDPEPFCDYLLDSELYFRFSHEARVYLARHHVVICERIPEKPNKKCYVENLYSVDLIGFSGHDYETIAYRVSFNRMNELLTDLQAIEDFKTGCNWLRKDDD